MTGTAPPHRLYGRAAAHTPLGDDLFRIVHHHVTGRLLIPRRAAGIGLAGALLAELLYARRLTFDEDGLRVLDHRPPDEPLARHILGEIFAPGWEADLAQAKGHPTENLLKILAGDAEEMIGRRLQDAGHVHYQRRLFTDDLWVPTSWSTAEAPNVRLRDALTRGTDLTGPDVCLAGLAWTLGMHRVILAGAPDRAARGLDLLISHAWPPMGHLITRTHATIGKAVTAHRA